MSIEPQHRRIVRQETIVSVVINALVPAGIIWFLDAAPPGSLFGNHPLLAAILPAAGLATFMMTMILTTLIRLRVRKGVLPRLDWPTVERGMMRLIPANLVLRAGVLAVLAILLLVPTALLVIRVLGVLPFTKVEFLYFNLVFGAIVGLIMARFVVLHALSD